MTLPQVQCIELFPDGAKLPLSRVAFRLFPRSDRPIRLKVLLEPIREVLEPDELDVIPCLALDSSGSARWGSLNTAVR